MQLSARSVGLIEAVYNSVKPHELLAAEIEIASGSGKIPDGTEIPFEFRLDGIRGRTLHESELTRNGFCSAARCECACGVCA